MLATHLHPACWNPPHPLVEVELGPLGVPEFAWTDNYQGQQPQCGDGREITLITLNRTQQRADLLRICNGREMLGLDGRQCATQVLRGILHTPPGGN